MTEKSQVADIDRSIYDIRDAEHDAYRMEAGLTPAIVEKLSKEKNDPAWMEQFRLESLQIYNNMRVPDWGPSLDGLDIDHIATYVRPNTKMQNNWENVPQDIKDTFERLGIPQAERKSLAGVGAQYDSELVYHNMQDTASKMGIVYSGIEEALHDPQWEPLIHEKFMHQTLEKRAIPLVCKPVQKRVRSFHADAVYILKALAALDTRKEALRAECRNELFARICADVRNAERKDEVNRISFAALFDGRHQVGAGLFAKALERDDLACVVVQMVEIRKIAQVAAVDELVQRLHRETVNIKTRLARKTNKAL